MIRSLFFYESKETDPYINLAIEQQLLENVHPYSCILYLWQNKNTVVIGRNQNPWIECRTELLESEGGKLARRLSGGGAVYHDLGNLNFTFLMPEELFDLNKQLQVVQTACNMLGISTTFSGRNDLLADGRKFSGNAFYHSAGKAYHHGTLLINADMNKLSRYLSPPKAKLEAKGVSSIRSRVTNLNEFVPDLTCLDVKRCMYAAFEKVYAVTPAAFEFTDEDWKQILDKSKENSSWQWLYGTPLPLSFSCADRFVWGSIQLDLQVNKGLITDTRVYTDAMEWQAAQQIRNCLHNCKFHTSDMITALRSCKELPNNICTDLCQLLHAQEL